MGNCTNFNGACNSDCSCPCFPKTRPKYKQHILNVYPDDIENSQPKNVRDLLHYAQQYPTKLPNIGRYVEKLIRRDLEAGLINRVKAMISVLNQLMEVCCNSDITTLALYDTNVISIILLFFSSTDVELILSGCFTFKSFALYQDAAHDSRKLNDFFEPLVILCQNESNEMRRIRLAALSAMRKMIIYNDNTPSYFSLIIPAVLDNFPLQEDIFEIKSDEDEFSDASFLSIKCFENVAMLLTLNNMSTFLDIFLRYLDLHIWPSFSIHALRIIADYSRTKLKNAYLLLSNLFLHVELLPSLNYIRDIPSLPVQMLQSKMTNTIANLILSMHCPIGPWQNIILSLLKAICRSDISKDYIQCIRAYCQRLTSAFDVFGILGMCCDESGGASLSPQCRKTLYETGLFIAMQHHPDLNGQISDRIIFSILKRIKNEEDSSLHPLIWNIVTNLIIPSDLIEYDELNQFSSAPRFVKLFNFNSDDASFEIIREFSLKFITNPVQTSLWFQSATYFDLINPNSVLQTFLSIFNVFVSFLIVQPFVEIVNHFPMFVHLQNLGFSMKESLHKTFLFLLLPSYCLYFAKIISRIEEYKVLASELENECFQLLQEYKFEMISSDVFEKNAIKLPNGRIIVIENISFCDFPSLINSTNDKIINLSNCIEKILHQKSSHNNHVSLSLLEKVFVPSNLDEIITKFDMDYAEENSIIESVHETSPPDPNLIVIDEKNSSRYPLEKKIDKPPPITRTFSEIIQQSLQRFGISKPLKEEKKMKLEPAIEMIETKVDIYDESKDQSNLVIIPTNKEELTEVKTESNLCSKIKYENDSKTIYQTQIIDIDSKIDFSSNEFSPQDKLYAIIHQAESEDE